MKPSVVVVLQLEVEKYRRLEEELSQGVPIEDRAIRAEHAAIKAKVESGRSLEEAILRHVAEDLDKLDAQIRASAGTN